jgi:predicted metal-dependent hydrolase
MPRPDIEVRNLRFSLDASIPKHWLAGKRAVSIFFDNLSVLFPAGERFFMLSVRHFEGAVSDPKLKQDMRGFAQQEALHSREHVRYNDRLRTLGYPVDEMDRKVRELLGRASELPPREQLAITCALEHFTAVFAEFVLSEDGSLDGAHPVMAALWRWHAAEEGEHAPVAFDVFRAVGGTYSERVRAMALATLIFWSLLIDQQLRMMRVDGSLWSPSEWRSLMRFFFREPGWLRKLARPYLAYYRPGFHPAQSDRSALLGRWREDFAGLSVYRDSASAA